MATLKLGIFGDAGNSMTNGTSFYYSPGDYRRYSIGATGPYQRAVADMMRSWGVTELLQLGDASYNTNSSSLLDYNIGQYYNDYLGVYGNNPKEFIFSDPSSIYSQASLGGIDAKTGNKQWPYNLYNFPLGFPNPTTGGTGGSADGLNHFWLTPGNHDGSTIVGTYNDASVNQVNFRREYVGPPLGPDAHDYANNINTDPAPPDSPDFKDNKAVVKTGSIQQLLDYLPYLNMRAGEPTPNYLKEGQVKIGKNDPDGYGLYYSVDLGETIIDGVKRPLLHLVMLDSTRLMTDAGYYDFNFLSRKDEAASLGTTSDNYSFDATDPTSIALFQSPDTPDGSPSISYEMYEWAKADLEQSGAVWNFVTAHHPAYHVGNATDPSNKGYFNNPVMIKLLAGLKDSSGKALFDAFFNGHSHAYSRVLEMATSDNGIGPGIPFVTTGNGGKDLDALNLAPYGTSVLTPENWQLTSNISQLNPEYLAELPSAALPTSVGLSGFFHYSKDNLDAAGEDTSPYIIEKNGETFELTQSVYNSLLAAGTAASADVSGLYGYGSGAAYVEINDEYFFTDYQSAHPLDPAILLIGQSQGKTVDQMKRGSLFYEQWSPRSAKVDDLALFSFKVIVDELDKSGYLGDLQLVQAGNGYLEETIGSNKYLEGSYTLEILGNNPKNPLGFDLADPSRAAVELTFRDGQLQSVAFAKDTSDNLRLGTGYLQLANAINENNKNTSSKNSLLVGISINLEAQAVLADQSPDNSLYGDSYLVTNTRISPQATATGWFGGLSVGLEASTNEAKQILANQALTTGYSGIGAQRTYAAPQQGSIEVIDSNGINVASASVNAVQNGLTSLQFDRRPAPGAVNVEFGGDPFSSYLVNFREARQAINVTYGSWNSGISKAEPGMLTFTEDIRLSLARQDSISALISFGLRKSGSSTPAVLIAAPQAAQNSSITTNSVFIPSGEDSWLASEFKSLGSRSSLGQIGSGGWTPVAVTASGEELSITGLEVSGNAIEATFAGGFKALYNAEGTGSAAEPLPGSGKISVTVQRLGMQENGLAFYKADKITGAVKNENGEPILPGHSGYLQAALASAAKDDLILGPEDMPAYGGERLINDLKLSSTQNYGLLLLRNNSQVDLMSSYSEANPGGTVGMVSFFAPERGMVYGIEDILGPQSDNDFNDLIVSIASANFQILSL